jgi:hypothetical protein
MSGALGVIFCCMRALLRRVSGCMTGACGKNHRLMRKLSVIGLAVLAAVAGFLLAVRQLKAARRERVVSETPLDTLTRDELYDLAREQDIPGRSKMKKNELRAALERR